MTCPRSSKQSVRLDKIKNIGGVAIFAQNNDFQTTENCQDNIILTLWMEVTIPEKLLQHLGVYQTDLTLTVPRMTRSGIFCFTKTWEIAWSIYFEEFCIFKKYWNARLLKNIPKKKCYKYLMLRLKNKSNTDRSERSPTVCWLVKAVPALAPSGRDNFAVVVQNARCLLELISKRSNDN